MTQFYVPILKSKVGEFDALSKLPEIQKPLIHPLFDVTPMEWDHAYLTKPKTLKEHLQKFCNKALKGWPRNNMFIDTYLIADKNLDGLECIEFIFQELAKNSVIPIPVVHLNSTGDFLKSIYSFHFWGEIAIRVTIGDITSGEFDNKVNHILGSLDLTYSECHLIIDLKDADFSQVDDFAEGLTDIVSGFTHYDDWKTFTIAGGAFPSTSKIKGPAEIVPRNDWKLFNKVIQNLAAAGKVRTINYGDYSIVTPGYFEFDPKIMSTSANIRYTSSDGWLVLKGKALKKRTDWQQYFGQADEIVNSPYYMGSTFSHGDKHLKECSNRTTTSGNANTWMAVGNNHHFAKVLSDLFSSAP